MGASCGLVEHLRGVMEVGFLLEEVPHKPRSPSSVSAQRKVSFSRQHISSSSPSYVSPTHPSVSRIGSLMQHSTFCGVVWGRDGGYREHQNHHHLRTSGRTSSSQRQLSPFSCHCSE